MKASQEIKEALLKACQQWVQQKIATAKAAMDEAQAAANSEEKSSAGDKYETARAMAQNERDQAAHQLAEALALEKTVHQIQVMPHSLTPALGSLVITDKQSFYLAISAGKLNVHDQEYMAVSLASPIGKLLLQSAKGKTFTFNKQTYTVVDVK